MSGERDRCVEDLLQQYQRQRSGLAELHRRMQEVSATAVSPRREVSVTVNHNGGVTDIKFTGSAYRRMTPQELSAVIMRTLHDAREQAADEAARIIAPILPEGLNARDVVSGRLSTEQLVPSSGPRMPQVVREQLAR
ncbi:YbaB/EbfC DNA-binding family protein [Krasilnikovia cinnamomea]|uniref:YbaB/EbfC DNA-binding family protein n=1 Tax=Krasilnikovia cinnamomea TaxID=349313 RepID=A0A4Q7ZQT3_9ACTN|nr:YbaB/EbfC family nucleoid-associated protein [Krasilnikovia cinnamomea]RZU53492.1 YbaB/EbfC DNA-binding family protein [Krasilnikovia cinnamomea]